MPENSDVSGAGGIALILITTGVVALCILAGIVWGIWELI